MSTQQLMLGAIAALGGWMFYQNYKKSSGSKAGIEPMGASGGEYTIVLFKRDGCPHCDKFLPVFKSLKGHPKVYGNVKLKVVETSKRPDLANKYNIEGVPSILKFKNEHDLIGTFDGDYMDQEKLINWMLA